VGEVSAGFNVVTNDSDEEPQDEHWGRSLFVRVWLDDRRPAPRGWRRCYTPDQMIELLQTGEVTEISLDHDLGLTEGEREETGYDVLLWMGLSD
jgi:hypothetical protein